MIICYVFICLNFNANAEEENLRILATSNTMYKIGGFDFFSSNFEKLDGFYNSC